MGAFYPIMTKYFRYSEYFAVPVLVIAATGMALALERLIAFEDADMVFLMPVLFAALRWGLWSAVSASLLGALSYNFFFLPPRYSLEIASPADIFDLIIFLLVALIISNLVTQIQRQTQEQAERARIAEELYKFSSNISSITSLDGLLPIIAAQISTILNCHVAVLLPSGTGLDIKTRYPKECQFTDEDIQQAWHIWTLKQQPYNTLHYEKSHDPLIVPLLTRLGNVGILAMKFNEPKQHLPDENNLIGSMVNQSAVAIERIVIAEERDRIRLLAESERLKNVVLASISLGG